MSATRSDPESVISDDAPCGQILVDAAGSILASNTRFADCAGKLTAALREAGLKTLLTLDASVNST